MVDNVFILAGGSGTRLWPASNRKNPKQFLEIKDGKSLLLLTLERALSLSGSVRVFIITLKDQMEDIIAECSGLSGTERIFILPEPAARNTAPAIAACTSYLIEEGRGEETVLVLPADHLIEPLGRFKADVEKACSLAERGYLVTFGIEPSYPATGYGYIESGAIESDGYRVKSFKEKPDRDGAERFIDSGNYYWNSGMFVFSSGRYWEELLKGAPEIASVFKGIGESSTGSFRNGIKIIMDNSDVEEIYKRSPKDSIDYAVLEKCEKTAVVPGSFTWNDIGSWDEMAELPERDSTPETPPVIKIESKNNYVLSDIPVALCGVDDIMVVQKNGSLLICRKGSGQLVKDAVEQIKTAGFKDIL